MTLVIQNNTITLTISIPFAIMLIAMVAGAAAICLFDPTAHEDDDETDG